MKNNLTVEKFLQHIEKNISVYEKKFNDYPEGEYITS
jgi:hypothetical protein